ncbi:uncharacterized protein KY384_006745 [Bacidia gigantensis]|uniref:uncharacterized protein n=1 Tax=Bacidia gigantensis TaxID=2732470 RepID=UPI001D03E6A2|nr:uncharacterized protein KY384_006745 [Bacidia gigantensis]KAG8527829.1 hypothetical protein KY384_006745 [Bacidia gigantensis]
MTQPILVTGATGHQGGALVRALLNHQNPPMILALTRSTSSATAQKLASSSPCIKLVQGSLNNVAEVFDTATKIAQRPIWGVFSVQPAQGMGIPNEAEQGKGLVDESVSRGVKHFVYASVDRGGDEKSWTNPTNIPHFQTKHEIELHLREKAESSGMGYTILRPVAFMDNLAPGFQARVFLAALQATFAPGKTLQWIAVRDIGIVGAKAFEEPEKFNGKAIGLAGDDLTIDQIGEVFKETTGTALTPTFQIFGKALKQFVAEVRLMVDWFGEEGYGVDIGALKQIHPDLIDLKTWIVEDSTFTTKA